MKILVLSDIEAGGEWLATQAFLSEIRKRRPKIKFYLIAYGKNTLLLNRKVFAKIILLRIPPLIPPFRYYRQLLFEIKTGVKILRQVVKVVGKFDLIVATEHSLLLSSLFAMPFVKSLFWFHNFRHYFKLGIKNFNFYMFLCKFEERLAWVLSNKIIVPSVFAKSSVAKELGLASKIKKITVVENVVSEEFRKKCSERELVKFKKKWRLPLRAKIFLYSGRVSEEKGLENLISAFAILRKEINNIYLVLAYMNLKTNKEVFEKVERLILSKKFRDNVLMIGNLPRQELAKLYQISHCAILPSEREMSSLFLLESIHSGLPIFSTPTGTAKELLEKIDPLFVLKDNSKETIYRVLKEFFEKPNSWLMKKKAQIRKLAKKLDHQDSIKDFLKLLH